MGLWWKIAGFCDYLPRSVPNLSRESWKMPTGKLRIRPKKRPPRPQAKVGCDFFPGGNLGFLFNLIFYGLPSAYSVKAA